MNILSAQEIAKSHGLKQLFSGLSLGIDDRDRIGLIGANGCGKSTLLQVLAGTVEPDAGMVTLRQDTAIQFLPQNPLFRPGETVLESIFSTNEAIPALVREYEDVCARMHLDPHSEALHKRFDETSRRMEAAGAWEYEHLARAILGKLGVTDLEAQVDLLSGGYRKRVALARTLLGRADLLILDEPTNHLDADTVAWLEDYLRRYSGAVLLVTHDRYFLDRVTQRIVELDGGELREFEGNFSYYLARKTELEAAAVARQAHRRAILRKELEWLKRGARARTTKQKARVERVRELQDSPTVQARDPMAFQIETRRLGGKILELDHVSKSFGALPLISDFTYTFKAGERLGIIGPNGTGKTTLANLMTGRMQPDSGSVNVGQTVAFGYFDQESSGFDLSERAIDYVRREGGDMLRGTDGTFVSAANLLERFYFTSEMLYTPIEKLSGGERRRLYLVRILMGNPNFLVLDEPANDLDIPTLQALEDLLDGFPGCLVVISHDRYFLDRTIEHVLSFEGGGTLRTYPGDYSTYESMRADAGPEVRQNAPATPARLPKQKSLKLTYNEQRELARLDEEIPRMETRLAAIEGEMVEAATDYQRLNALTAERTQLAVSLEQAETRWLELSDRRS